MKQKRPHEEEKKPTCFKLPSLYLRFFQGLGEIFILQIKWSAASWWHHGGNPWVLPQASLLRIFDAYWPTMTLWWIEVLGPSSAGREVLPRSPLTGTFPQLKRESRSWYLDPAGRVTEAQRPKLTPGGVSRQTNRNSTLKGSASYYVLLNHLWDQSGADRHIFSL